MLSTRSRPVRIALIALLIIAALVLVAVAAVVAPILLHRSAGGSGQAVPDTIVSSVTATGADDRTRTLTAQNSDGAPAALDALEPGQQLQIDGGGFDAGIGIYVAICAIPATADEKPGPCLGGIPEGAQSGDADLSHLSSAWVTNDWAWRNFATHAFTEDGDFSVELTVPEPEIDGLDCRVQRCAIATRADHTASSDRVQDLLLPVAYRE